MHPGHSVVKNSWKNTFPKQTWLVPRNRNTVSFNNLAKFQEVGNSGNVQNFKTRQPASALVTRILFRTRTTRRMPWRTRESFSFLSARASPNISVSYTPIYFLFFSLNSNLTASTPFWNQSERAETTDSDKSISVFMFMFELFLIRTII